ncbi:NAD(P)-binding domain-containing protein [Alphaproteobacteria bacterium KMM 3653]|uniref:NAD(P)-binding domain-containing protein n=1 Tax=Harenicola maris TaxID=2841044 RepID=A0AAP2CPK7_9RHOB|nr:NAD(P)-binding domain-containing protein [Harenicola maris]
MSIVQVPFEAERFLDWRELAQAIAAGHALPRAEIGDTFLYRGGDTLLSRSAWIDGMGIAVKSATIFPGNAGPNVNGSVSLFSDSDGTLEAIVDFHLVTKWKTAGDSLLGAMRLARADARRVLIVGAGTVAGTLIEAYRAGFEGAEVTLWNRTRAKAEALAAQYPGVAVAGDLEAAVGEADIVSCATMSTQPVLRGDWVQPGTHVDLIGAYRPDMREADDALLQKGRLFVDARATTLGHIGEVMMPLESGVISEADILADYYDGDAMARGSDAEITVFKNGGGAHLDLMVSRYVLEKWQGQPGL